MHCHPVLSYVQKLKSVAHQEGMLNSIAKFHPNGQTRKQLYKNVFKFPVMQRNSSIFYQIRFHTDSL